jgi:hypothetical protein
MERLQKPEADQPTMIRIDGQALELFFSLRMLKRLHKEHGINVLKPATWGELMQDPEKLSIMLQAGLKAKQPQLDEDWIEDHVDASIILDLGPYILRAMSGRWPAELAERLESPLGVTPGISTGSISGPSDATTSGLVNGISGG